MRIKHVIFGMRNAIVRERLNGIQNKKERALKIESALALTLSTPFGCG